VHRSEMNTGIHFSAGRKVSFAASLESVPAVVSDICSCCRLHQMEAKDLQSIELVCTEALNNAVEHGADKNSSHSISAFWWIEQERFMMDIEDPGDFLPDGEAAQLPSDELSERGRGLFIIQQLADEVKHYLLEGRHHVRLGIGLSELSVTPDSTEEMELLVGSMTEELSAAYENLSALFRLGERLALCSSFQDFVDSSLQDLMELTQSDGAMVAAWQDESRLKTIGAKGIFSALLSHEQAASERAIEVDAALNSKEYSLEAHEIIQSADPFSKFGGHFFCAPMSFSDRPAGVLTLHRTDDHAFYTAAQTHIARTFTDFFSIVINLEELQAQRAEQEIELREVRIAAEIQKRLLPREFPVSSSFSVAGACNSARQVGGDYLDVISVDENSFLLVMADVMGKGVPAAMLATIFRTALYARLDIVERPAELMSEIGEQLYRDIGQLDMFITAQIAYCDIASETISIANAGHCPAALWDASGNCRMVSEGGVPLGILGEQKYKASEAAFHKNNRLMLFTDGLYEVQDPAGQYLNVEGFIEMLDPFLKVETHTFIEKVLFSVNEYTDHATPSDDRSILVVDNLASTV